MRRIRWHKHHAGEQSKMVLKKTDDSTNDVEQSGRAESFEGNLESISRTITAAATHAIAKEEYVV